MKILYLANAKSVHTKKWVDYFVKNGFKVYVISLTDAALPGAKVFSLGYKNIKKEGDFEKILYFTEIRKIKRLIKKISPDILHAHYATGYGISGALSGFHPYIISVWGSDIFEFPKKSFFHKKLIGFNLKKADYICSTSHVMAKETKKYTNKNILITPFGVDCEKFKPASKLKPKDKIIIGTIKALEKKYGIKYLINAFAILVKKHSNLPLELHIGGKGSLERKLQQLCENLGIKNKVKFLGYIPHDKVPDIFNTFSVSVSVSASESESFGVAVIEAEACRIPVVVSDIGGLPEVVQDNVTGFIVPPKNPEATAEAIEKLILDENLRNKMGVAGREFVLKNYEWSKNAKIMENLYKTIIRAKSKKLYGEQ